MPKKSGKKGRGELTETSAADSDAMSVRSTPGSPSTYSEDGDRLGDFDDDGASGSAMEVDTRSAQDVFEDKLKEAIDGVLEKSLKSRVNSIKSVSNALKKKVIPDFVIERHVTITDALERCIKKGKGEEQTEAARALSLLCIQLGLTDEGEAMFTTVKPTLLSIIQDPSALPAGKAGCAEALGLCAFISANDLELVATLMSHFETIFSKSYQKGDKTTPSHSPATCALHSAALDAWCLLLTVASPNMVAQYLDSPLRKLTYLLDSPDVDLRITGGEAIALIYEMAWMSDEDFIGPNMTELCEKLKQLSTENSKHQAKKNRKQQRSSFRDVLTFIEDGQFDSFECKFGTETVYIDSWLKKRQYDAFCNQLESGTNTHLKDNLLLRDIFDLGAPLAPGPLTKISKQDRKLYNQAVFKARSQVRQKQRDKRAAQLSG